MRRHKYYQLECQTGVSGIHFALRWWKQVMGYEWRFNVCPVLMTCEGDYLTICIIYFDDFYKKQWSPFMLWDHEMIVIYWDKTVKRKKHEIISEHNNENVYEISIIMSWVQYHYLISPLSKPCVSQTRFVSVLAENIKSKCILWEMW